MNLTTVTSKKSPFGVWIGNLSFDTTREDLIRFIVGKTTTLDPKITEEDITRVNIPKRVIKSKGLHMLMYLLRLMLKLLLVFQNQF